MELQIFLIIIFFFEIYNINGIHFHLPTNSKKCLREEIHKDVLVTGEYDISKTSDHKTNLKVIDTKNHILYQKENALKGKFAFTTDDYDIFDVCFESISSNKNQQDSIIFLSLKHGIEAKNYADMAQAEKLKPLETELKRLEDLAQSVVNDFSYMKSREEDMRNTNESTHSRVFYISFFSIGCLLFLAIWQILYLRKYFRSKKLID